MYKIENIQAKSLGRNKKCRKYSETKTVETKKKKKKKED